MIVKNQRLYVGDRELTLDVAAITLTATVEPQDDTRLQATTRVYEAGLVAHTWSVEGFFESLSGTDSQDEDLFEGLGAEVPVSVLAEGSSAGDDVYFLNALETEYVPVGGEVGASHRFSLAGVAAGPGLRGWLLHRGTVTVTGSGGAVNLATSNGKVIYGALHVVAVSGTSPTLTVRIQRDDLVGMASPTTEITFAAKTARGSEFKGPEPGAGAADTWWRADWTVGGTNPSFTIAVVMAIADA